MKCPHCLDSFHEENKEDYIGGDIDNSMYKLIKTKCPACERIILRLNIGSVDDSGMEQYSTKLLYPKGISRAPLSKHIPNEYAEDYNEACLVLSDSAKASAALSRRCLQNILRGVAKVKPSNLSDEIQDILDSKQLPSQLSEAIDAIRNIGNFATHPNKSKNSGAVIDVEPGEAEWNLDVLEGLFDHYFIGPALLKAKKDALNKKLKDAGKPEMK